jgi:hypothetical protein
MMTPQEIVMNHVCPGLGEFQPEPRGGIGQQ